MGQQTRQLILSCEHGGQQIPPEYAYLFKHTRNILNTHRGYDIGALAVARALEKALAAPLLSSEISRLLVDLNRSLHHRNLFSEFIRPLSAKTRTAILNRFYHPYRQAIEQATSAFIANKRSVIHLSIHSFTPQLGDQIRNNDIGLLYDPARRLERIFCLQLQEQLQNLSDLRVRRNYPYRGNADGLTTALRRRFPARRYLGIEIEINQALLNGPRNQHQYIASALYRAISKTVAA
jgi:predicted N-formylglutamate amidohydrolase